MRVFLAGEGRHELGGWARRPPYRDKDKGVLQTLLDLVAPGVWSISDAKQWKDIVKLQPGLFRHAETRNVEGAILHAEEAHCDVVAFTRDRDGDRQREKEIASCIARERTEAAIAIIGGVPVEQIESWVLSCKGIAAAESLPNSKFELEIRFPPGDLKSMVAIIERADPARLPPDARSLRDWLGQARAVAAKAAI